MTILLAVQVALALCVLPDSLGVESPVIWRQDFEDTLPGYIPIGWHKAWGTMPPDDILATSNIESAGGKRSLLIDHLASSDKATMYGICVSTPPIQAPLIKFSICFMPVGSANETSFSMELRTAGNSERMATLSIAGRTVALTRGDWKKSVPLGKFEFERWNRMTVWLPCVPGDKSGNVRALLETRNDDGSWRTVSETVSMELYKPIAADRKIGVMFNIPGGKGPFKLYLDDIAIEAAAEAGK